MVIRIPIEVQTSESTEIRELLDRIERADDKLSSIRTAAPANPATDAGRAEAAALLQGERGATGIRQDTSRTGRNPITGAEGARTTAVGTPNLATTESALPRAGVKGVVQPGGGSAQDLVRQNQFTALQEQTAGIEQNLNKALGIGGQAIGVGALVARGGPSAGFNKLLSSPLTKIIGGPIAIAFLAKTIIDTVMEELLKPGGLFDRRFKRNFEDEFNTLRSRESKGEIRAGLKQIRFSQGPIGKRAQDYTQTTTLSNVKNGIYPDEEFDLGFGSIGP